MSNACNCGATSEGKWADKHDSGCPALNIATIEQLKKLVALQAEDDALWLPGRTIDHAYCQQALRFLTRAIEGEWSFEEARDAIKDMMP